MKALSIQVGSRITNINSDYIHTNSAIVLLDVVQFSLRTSDPLTLAPLLPSLRSLREERQASL